MRRAKENSKVYIVAEKFEKEGKQKLDYFIVTKDYKRYYAFTRNYSTVCYEMCKNGIMVHKLWVKRCNNIAVMRLVNHLKRMWKYLTEYYELEEKKKKGKCA